jgi:hypothetical protein
MAMKRKSKRRRLAEENRLREARRRRRARHRHEYADEFYEGPRQPIDLAAFSAAIKEHVLPTMVAQFNATASIPAGAYSLLRQKP